MRFLKRVTLNLALLVFLRGKEFLFWNIIALMCYHANRGNITASTGLQPHFSRIILYGKKRKAKCILPLF